MTYYPGGDTTKPAAHGQAAPGAVPHRLPGQRRATRPNGGVTRQWIHKTGDTTYREYMSQWYYTNPQPEPARAHDAPAGRAHLVDDQRPAGELQLADGSGHAVPEHGHRHRRRAVPRRRRHGDGDLHPRQREHAGLGDRRQRRRQPDRASAPRRCRRRWRRWAPRRRRTSPAARAALIAAAVGGDARRDADREPDARSSVPGASPSSARTSLLNAWGSADSPGSVAGGAAAVRALDVFFGGLPGGVVSTRTVTANTVKQGTAPTITVDDRQRARAQAGRQRLAGRPAGRHDGRVGVDRGRQRRGLLHAPGPGRGHVRLHVVLRG